VTEKYPAIKSKPGKKFFAKIIKGERDRGMK